MQITAPKKVINAWAMYDWANSVYNLVITTTFFPIYFLAVTKQPEWGNGNAVPILGIKFINSSLYDYCIAFAYLLIALSYPILTSVADTRGNKKNFMRFFCYMGAMGCASLYFFQKETLWIGICGLILGAMGYVGSLVFYNAYLPELAAPEDRDRISAKGYSYGYVGSVLLQLIGFALVIVMKGNEGTASRITFALVGIWWFGFAQITFRGLPRVDRKALKKVNVFTDGFTEIKKVYAQVSKMPVLKRFLRGFFFYSMGVQTVMLAATQFGSKTLAMDETKLIVSVVLIQLVAILGAVVMSRLSARFTNIPVLIGVIVLWMGICLAAFLTAQKAEPLKPFHDQVEALEMKKKTMQEFNATDAEYKLVDKEIATLKASFADQQTPVEYCFYGLAIAVGLVMGGIQSLSRSTYSKLMPETKDTASYFAYYDFTEKIAIVIGMFSFGTIHQVTGSMKYSVLSLMIFFFIGLIWLFSTRHKQLQDEKAKFIDANFNVQ